MADESDIENIIVSNDFKEKMVKQRKPFVMKYGSCVPEAHVYFRHRETGGIIAISLHSLAYEWPSAVISGKDYLLCSMADMIELCDADEDYFLMNNIWRIIFDTVEEDY